MLDCRQNIGTACPAPALPLSSSLQVMVHVQATSTWPWTGEESDGVGKSPNASQMLKRGMLVYGLSVMSSFVENILH